jgi:phosphogluconate dehydratase
MVAEDEWNRRAVRTLSSDSSHGYGRDLFVAQRRGVTAPEKGASTLFID